MRCCSSSKRAPSAGRRHCGKPRTSRVWTSAGQRAAEISATSYGCAQVADCGGVPAPQVKHEIKMLRELLAAEQRKLDALKPERGEARPDELSLKLAELNKRKA